MTIRISGQALSIQPVVPTHRRWQTAVCLLVSCFLGCGESMVLAAGSSKIPVTDQSFIADFYSTEEAAPKPGILVLGGAEGGKPDGLAKLFADRGYPVLSLAYFGIKGTPDHLDMVPLEYFAPAIDWLAKRPDVRGGAVILVGASKGAELALLLASKDPRIKEVIAIAPSSVVWQGIPKIYFPPIQLEPGWQGRRVCAVRLQQRISQPQQPSGHL